MTVELVKYPSEEDWMLCKTITLATAGKVAKQQPTEDWKHRILEARHSPIRTLNYFFRMTDIPYFVSVHLCRHVHALPFIETQRTDRTGVNRNKKPQDAPIGMWYVVNAEELMIVANKRLCWLASEETWKTVNLMCQAVEDVCPEFKGLLVPMCEYGRCHEMYPCGKREQNQE